MNIKQIILDGSQTNYGVDEYGNIYNTMRNKKLTSHLSHSGYYRTGIRVNKKPKTMTNHRLVALMFVNNDEPESKNVVNHLDGVKTNNHYTNLEWTTVQGNTVHAWETGLSVSTDKKKVKQYDLNGDFIKEYESITEASKQTGSLDSKITLVCQRKRDQHNSFQWRYSSEKDTDVGFVPEDSYLKPKEVIQKDLEGREIGRYRSTREAAKSIGGTQSAISRCCNGVAKTHKGFKWQFS